MPSQKYIPPFGSSNPNASYDNGNAELGTPGSIADARVWEWTQRELINAISAQGITPDGDVLTQLADAIRARAIKQVGRGISVVHAAAQSIPNSVETALAWPAPIYDSDTVWNPAQPTRIKIPAGTKKVRVIGQITFENNATGSRKARILIDGLYEGSGFGANRVPSAGSTDVAILPVAGGIVDITALTPALIPDGSNYIQLLATQDSGGALNTRLANTWLTVEFFD